MIDSLFMTCRDASRLTYCYPVLHDFVSRYLLVMCLSKKLAQARCMWGSVGGMWNLQSLTAKHRAASGKCVNVFNVQTARRYEVREHR